MHPGAVHRRRTLSASSQPLTATGSGRHRAPRTARSPVHRCCRPAQNVTLRPVRARGHTLPDPAVLIQRCRQVSWMAGLAEAVHSGPLHPGRSSMQLVLALDQGTISSRAILFAHSGRVRGMAEREFEQHLPVDDSAGVYLVPAFTGLAAPHWDPYARGTIVGLTRGTTSRHIARSALEGIAHQVGDVVEAMRKDTGLNIRELRRWRSGLQRSPDAVPGEHPRHASRAPADHRDHGARRGVLAGLAVGFWKGRDDLATNWHVERRFEPSMALADIERRRSRWASALDRSRLWETP